MKNRKFVELSAQELESVNGLFKFFIMKNLFSKDFEIYLFGYQLR